MMETMGAWVGVGLTVFILSFLYKDNPFYKLAEHIYLGVSAGYWLVVVFHTNILPELIMPLRESGGDPGKLAMALTPIALSLLMFATLFKKIAWLATIPIAFVIGAFAGAQIIGFASSDLIIQIQSSMQPLWASGQTTWREAINNWIGFAGLICCLLFFFFSREHKGALGAASRVGMYFLMISFGASFGYTVMGRISLAIGRAQELYDYHYATLVFTVLVVAGVFLTGRLRKPPAESAEMKQP
ncbi:MAG: hypothetical protein GMKNLPBB_00281 [Myxococcota bacterium]|nr:hypothetical protein [Myxococcota bacterium]